MVLSFKSVAEAERLAEEYRDAGRDVIINKKDHTITVLALPLNYKKKRERENRIKRNQERTLDEWETRYAEYS